MADNALYLEVDEEITAAIDRMTKAPGAEVKIVVPKRSTLLQSIVNLKLLKRAADDAGKKVVLVTSDQTSLHLAGRVGLAVASSVSASSAIPEISQPEPQAAEVLEAEDEPESDQAPSNDEKTADAKKTSAAAAGVAATGTAASAKPAFAKPMMVRTPVGPHEEGGKTSRVPNFDAMQKRLLIGGAVVAGIIALFVLNYFIKHATVTLYAKGSQTPSTINVTADPTATKSDPSTAVLAAVNSQSSHDLSTTVTATGTKDVGTKASGSIAIKNCYNSSDFTLPGGTKFTVNGKNFLSTADVPVTGGHVVGGACVSAGTGTAPVTAEQNGGDYNLASGTSYTVSGYPSSAASGLYGIGGQMSGGTSKTVGVIAQADIDKAKQQLLDGDKDAAQKDLTNKVSSDSQILDGSFAQTLGNMVASPNVGEEGSQSTVKLTVQYTLLSVKKADLEAVLKAQEQKQVKAGFQIYDSGLGSAQVTPTKVTPGAASTFALAVTYSAGQTIDIPAVAKQVSGKRFGDAADLASKTPGVDKAEISTWPFWVTKLPGITSHIKVLVKVEGS